MKNRNTGLAIELKNIFNILKSSKLSDFHILVDDKRKFNDIYTSSVYRENIKKTFLYKNDINLTITENEYDEKERVYDYNDFFDKNDNELELPGTYDNLIKKICKYKSFPDTYNNIRVDKWTVKYANIEVYNIYTLTISNLSTLYVSLPTSMCPFDFIYNFCSIVNDYVDVSSKESVNNDILKTLKIQNSNFDDFLKYNLDYVLSKWAIRDMK
jgi:hypothetical protein